MKDIYLTSLGCILPVGGALGSAVGGSLLTAGLAVMIDIPVKGVTLLGGGAISMIGWAISLAVYDDLVKEPELHYRDLSRAFDADAELMKRPPKEAIEFHVQQGRTTVLDWLPIGDWKRLHNVASVVADMQTLGYEHLTPKYDDLLSRGEWLRFRAVMVKHGLASWAPDGAAIPNVACLNLMRQIADERPTPRGDAILRIVFSGELHANASAQIGE